MSVSHPFEDRSTDANDDVVREAEVSMNEVADLVKEVQGERPKIINMGSLEDLEPKMEYVRKNGPLDMSTFPMFYMYWMNSGKVSLGKDENLDNESYPEVNTVGLRDWMTVNMKG